MRISLNEIKEAEAFISGTMPTDEAMLFHAKMILHPDLRENTTLLKRTLSLIRSFGRKNLLMQVQQAERDLFRQPEHTAFQKEVANIFTKS